MGSSFEGARVLVQAEAKGETLRAEWLTLAAGEQRVVEVPVPAALGETQLYVHLTQVRDNRLYLHTAAVQVATPPAPLVLSIATFRDKLQPGQQRNLARHHPPNRRKTGRRRAAGHALRQVAGRVPAPQLRAAGISPALFTRHAGLAGSVWAGRR